MTKDEVLKLALEALESHVVWFSHDTMIGKAMRNKAGNAITAIKDALRESALQALHDENERLGLYEGIYEAQPKRYTTEAMKVRQAVAQALTQSEQSAAQQTADQMFDLMAYGVSFSKNGKRVDPSKVLAQPEEEPVAMYEDWYNSNSCGHCGMVGGHTKTCRHYTSPPQRQPLTDEELYKVFPAIATYHEANKTLYRSIARLIEIAHGIRE